MLQDFGPAECSDNTAVTLPQIDSVIISDLIYNGVHPWLAESRSLAWIDALESAKRQFGKASTLYAGHGPSGGPQIMDEQLVYISDMRAMVVAELASGDRLSEAAKARISDHMLNRYRGFELASLVAANIDGISKELTADPETKSHTT